eukprot:1953862-Pyramimonas_sp.AAC.1
MCEIGPAPVPGPRRAAANGAPPPPPPARPRTAPPCIRSVTSGVFHVDSKVGQYVGWEKFAHCTTYCTLIRRIIRITRIVLFLLYDEFYDKITYHTERSIRSVSNVA